MSDWYHITNIENIDTPALVIYPERVRRNIEKVKTFVDDVQKLRPHVKTNKCPQVVQLMLQQGITKFKCATIAEAEMLALEGCKDVLLAYQPTGPKAHRFCELQRTFSGTIFSCLVDNQKSLSELSDIASSHDQQAKVYIDLNVGMNRTGVEPLYAFDLYTRCTSLPGIVFMGLHAYDGHLRDPDLILRKQKCDDAFGQVEALAQKIKHESGTPPRIVAGGTPTFPIHAQRDDVEASPGTFIFWDKGYEQLLKEQPFEFAALVITRVISHPSAHTLCLDLGHKSIASENPITQRVHFLNASGLIPTGHSEEHMVFNAENEKQFPPGTVLYGVPHHICPTVALYEDALVCENNVVQESWPVLSRRRKINI